MLDMLKDIIFAACNVFEEAFKDLLELLGENTKTTIEKWLQRFCGDYGKV